MATIRQEIAALPAEIDVKENAEKRVHYVSERPLARYQLQKNI